MDSGNDVATNTAAEMEGPVSSRWINSVTISIIVTATFLLLLLIDFSDVLFANSRREQALSLISPAMRVTQAERTLNSAGYLTLYIDTTPPWLQVSTMTAPPVTARLLHRLFPSSAVDDWLRDRLAAITRFYIRGTDQGQVDATRQGNPRYDLVPPRIVGMQQAPSQTF